ncbi:unnamed protein product [Prunus brigantina]
MLGEANRSVPVRRPSDTVPRYFEWYLKERDEDMLSFTRSLVALGETVALRTRPYQVYQAVETLPQILEGRAMEASTISNADGKRRVEVSTFRGLPLVFNFSFGSVSAVEPGFISSSSVMWTCLFFSSSFVTFLVKLCHDYCFLY